MLEAFISESRENLETAGRCFLALEQTPSDPELLNDVFRAMHTIKGSSGLFEIPALTRVVHAAEDVLDLVRNGELDLAPEHIDLFLDAMDLVSEWLDNLETRESLGDDAAARSQHLVQQLRSLIPGQDVPAPSAVETAPESQTSESPSMDSPPAETPVWIRKIPDALRQSLYEKALHAAPTLQLVHYRPDPQCFYAGEDPLLTMRTLPGLQWLHIEVDKPWDAPESLDPYQCNLVFSALTDAEASGILHHLRYVQENMHCEALQPAQLVFPVGDNGDPTPYEAFVPQAETHLNEGDLSALAEDIRPLLSLSGPELLQTSALHWMQRVLDSPQPDLALLRALLAVFRTGNFEPPEATPEEMAPAMPDAQDVTDAAPEFSEQAGTLRNDALKVLETQTEILKLPVNDAQESGRLGSVAEVARNVFATIGFKDTELQEGITQALDSQDPAALLACLQSAITHLKSALTDEERSTPTPTEPVRSASTAGSAPTHRETDTSVKPSVPKREAAVSPEAEAGSRSKTLKVDQARIDALMDLVAEMVVAKNSLPYLARRAENEFSSRQLAKEIKSQYAVINRLSEDLQSAVMQIRMVPVSSVFQRFPRLVRDLSRKLNKKIRLILEGEETEADKNVVENLADPLIHLVRNSLDHGLESPEERRAKGKPEEGRIILRAVPLDDQVVIEVEDDGKGIDPEIIKRKAYEKGIIDEQKLESITEREALQLIFAPGFSTAEQVSDISGRGVGMDVVRSAVKQAGGNVLVESRKDLGTTIRLTLPLSMAVTRVMMVEVAGQNYGVPMEHIVETVRVPRDELQRIKHSEAVVLRNRLIPLFRLRRLLQIPASEPDSDELAILVINLAGEEIGLILDEFHEGLDIIQKPLEGVMAGYPWLSGAALLGDGSVLLVLNIRELLQCQ